VAGFLSKTWLDHLVFILLRDEEQERGGTWRGAVAVAERLVALFDPQAQAADKQQDMAAIPALRDEIAATARRMGSGSNATVTALLGLLDNPGSWESHALERPQIPMAHPQPIGGPSAAPVMAAASNGDEDLTESERQMVERLRKMRFGTWFEFTEADGTTKRRIKLSWMSPLTSTCMFVDRAGMQAEIKSLKDLAQEILAGRARVIPRPKHPFIDRALVSIRKMLAGEDGGQASPARPAP
jgi:hypothetical protein